MALMMTSLVTGLAASAFEVAVVVGLAAVVVAVLSLHER